jgi:hypothetical protein
VLKDNRQNAKPPKAYKTFEELLAALFAWLSGC